MTSTPGAAKPRLTYLDTAKGLAIVSVVLLHLSNEKILFQTLAPWHIWQSVPVFLLVAGITGSMVWKKYKGNFAAYYRDLPPKVISLFTPYALVTLLYHMINEDPLPLDRFFNTMLMGYLGPGGYFVPLIVTHIIVFPLILAIRDKTRSDLVFLGIAFALNVFFELLFAFCDVESTKYIYRIYYFRYLFACCLGAVLADHNPFPKWVFRLLAGLSIVYMAMVSYTATPDGWNLPFIRNDSWYFQHYPAYFYTALLVFAIRDHERRIPFLRMWITLGKSSYEIFLFQLFFFITMYQHLNNGSLFMKGVSLLICLGGGLAVTRGKKLWADIRKTPK